MLALDLGLEKDLDEAPSRDFLMLLLDELFEGCRDLNIIIKFLYFLFL